MTLPDPDLIARLVTADCGLHLAGRPISLREGVPAIELVPTGSPVQQTFSIGVVPGWRHIDVNFEPGKFAADLVHEMGCSDASGRAAFLSIVESCRDDGATVALGVNGQSVDAFKSDTWPADWHHVRLELKRLHLDINLGNPIDDVRLVRLWTSRLACAVLCLMPLEDMREVEIFGAVQGFPEGAKLSVEVNRYERDRRNRAAALVIHGTACKACDLDMEAVYGEVGRGFVEVHHLTPVSEMGANYLVNPATDLVPLCANCHGIAHRREPPYTVDEIRRMLAS